MGLLSPFPVDAAESLGSLCLFLSVSEEDCLNGAGPDMLLTSPLGAWEAAVRAHHFRVGDTAVVDLEDALVVEVGLFVVWGALSSNIWEFG